MNDCKIANRNLFERLFKYFSQRLFQIKYLIFPRCLNDISSIIINYHTIPTQSFDYLFPEKNEKRW